MSTAFSGGLEEAAYIVLSAAAAPVMELSPDSVDSLLATLTWWARTEWVTATVDALVSSGDIALKIGRLSRGFLAGAVVVRRDFAAKKPARTRRWSL